MIMINKVDYVKYSDLCGDDIIKDVTVRLWKLKIGHTLKLMALAESSIN